MNSTTQRASQNCIHWSVSIKADLVPKAQLRLIIHHQKNSWKVCLRYKIWPLLSARFILRGEKNLESQFSPPKSQKFLSFLGEREGALPRVKRIPRMHVRVHLYNKCRWWKNAQDWGRSLITKCTGLVKCPIHLSIDAIARCPSSQFKGPCPYWSYVCVVCCSSLLLSLSVPGSKHLQRVGQRHRLQPEFAVAPQHSQKRLVPWWVPHSNLLCFYFPSHPTHHVNSSTRQIPRPPG
jgi:hypothetical protein